MHLGQRILDVSRLPRRGSWRATVIAWAAVVFHLAACAGLLAIVPGTDLALDVAQRQRWVLASIGLWTVAWSLWSLASMSLLALCVAWAMRLCQATSAARWAIAACVVIAAGLACDLCGETIMIGRAARGDLTREQFAATMRGYELLGPAAANGLYCAGGLLLSCVSWRRGWLRAWPGVMGFAMWIVGLGLTAATLVEHRDAMVVTGAGVMLLFIPWAGVMGWRMRPHG
jgi:hypothetical protein